MSSTSPSHERSWQRADPHAPAGVPRQRPGSRQTTPAAPRRSAATSPATRERRGAAEPAVTSPVGALLRRTAPEQARAQQRRVRAGRHGRRPSLLRLLLSGLPRRSRRH